MVAFHKLPGVRSCDCFALSAEGFEGPVGTRLFSDRRRLRNHALPYDPQWEIRGQKANLERPAKTETWEQEIARLTATRHCLSLRRSYKRPAGCRLAGGGRVPWLCGAIVAYVAYLCLWPEVLRFAPVAWTLVGAAWASGELRLPNVKNSSLPGAMP